MEKVDENELNPFKNLRAEIKGGILSPEKWEWLKTKELPLWKKSLRGDNDKKREAVIAELKAKNEPYGTPEVMNAIDFLGPRRVLELAIEAVEAVKAQLLH